MTKASRKFLLQLAEQVVAVYVVTFVGALIANGFGVQGTNHLGVVASAGLAAIPAALMVVKSFAARYVGDSESVLMLPMDQDEAHPF